MKKQAEEAERISREAENASESEDDVMPVERLKEMTEATRPLLLAERDEEMRRVRPNLPSAQKSGHVTPFFV